MKTFSCRIISIFLATLLCISLMACTQSKDSPTNTSSDAASDSGQSSSIQPTETDYKVPSYLNLDSELPIVKEGENVTLKIAVSARPNSGAPEDVWMWKFVKQKMNINVEIEQTTTPDAYRTLAFNSGNLPDVFLDMSITPVEMVTYGIQEKILIPITPYINDTVMPNLSAHYKEHPEWKKAITCPDGHIYSLGIIGDENDVGHIPRLFVNGEWLKKVNMEIPTTLDSFTEMLKAFKGLGEDITPIAGGFGKGATNPGVLLLSAFGYVTNDPQGLSPAIRNGEVVIPYGDKEVYGEYLKLMNEYYQAGYISKDFFTIDGTTVNAEIAGGKTGVIATPPHLYLKDTFTQWPAVKPLTSAYNPTPVWYSNQNAITTGGFSITNVCKYPEAACRFADFFFKYFYYEQLGPKAGTDDTLGIVSGWKIDMSVSGLVTFDDFINDPKYKGLVSTYNYRLEKLNGWPNLVLGYQIDQYHQMFAMDGLTYEPSFDLKTGEGWYRNEVTNNLLPHVVRGYPQIAFYDTETAKNIADLKTVLDTYAISESAKFITGARPLSELDSYFSALDAVGFQKYLSYYKDYYETVKQ